MKLSVPTIALACAAVLTATAVANAQSSRHYQGSRQYQQQGYFDYDAWASRHSSDPADRSGAANFKNLTPPAGGVGRVNSHTQN
jgi:hypothetical protein